MQLLRDVSHVFLKYHIRNAAYRCIVCDQDHEAYLRISSFFLLISPGRMTGYCFFFCLNCTESKRLGFPIMSNKHQYDHANDIVHGNNKKVKESQSLPCLLGKLLSSGLSLFNVTREISAIKADCES